jgi:hypothetical protein
MMLAPGSPLSKWLMLKAIVSAYGASTTALVAFRLLDHWNRKRGGQCDPSHKKIAEALKISRRTSMRHVRTLWQDGWILINGKAMPPDYKYEPSGEEEENDYDFVWSRTAPDAGAVTPTTLGSDEALTSGDMDVTGGSDSTTASGDSHDTERGNNERNLESPNDESNLEGEALLRLLELNFDDVLPRLPTESHDRRTR